MVTDQINHTLYGHEYRHVHFRQTEHGCLGELWTGQSGEDLPGFVVLTSRGRNPSPSGRQWHSGFLPGRFQGLNFNQW